MPIARKPATARRAPRLGPPGRESNVLTAARVRQAVLLELGAESALLGAAAEQLATALEKRTRPLAAALKTASIEGDAAASVEKPLLKAQMKETRAHDLAEKVRFSRMVAAVEAFNGRVMGARKEAHVGVLAAWRGSRAPWVCLVPWGRQGRQARAGLRGCLARAGPRAVTA